MVKFDLEAIKELSVADRVRLVQQIWDSIQPTAEQLPLTDEQGKLVEERLAEHRRDPSSAVAWEDVKARLESE